MKKPKQVKKSQKRDWFSSMLDEHTKYAIPIGPRFQAEVPEWKGPPQRKYPYKTLDSSKWLGTVIWSNRDTTTRETERDVVGRGRPHSCDCYTPGSVLCVNRHISEKTARLQIALGPAFIMWKFGEMGEAAAKSWKQSEQHKFMQLVTSEGVKKSKGSFDLDELERMDIEGATPVSKPATKAVAARQSRAPVTRKSTATTSKKRKSDSSIDLENFEFLTFTEAGEKMMNLHISGRLGVEKLMADHAALERNLEEALIQVKDLTTQAEHKKLHYQLKEQKIELLEKDLKQLKDQSEEAQAKMLQELKLSAYKSVLQAKIRMAEDVAKTDFSPTSWDLEGWKVKLAKLVAVVPESTGADHADAAEEQVVEPVVPVVVGNEGNDA